MPEPLELEYGKQPRPFPWKLAIALFALAITLVLLAPVIWKPVAPRWNQAMVLWEQHRVMNLSAPADQVMYEEDPALFKSLLKHSSAYFISSWPQTGEPDSVMFRWDIPHYVMINTDGIFVHERVSPNAQHRIVYIQINAGFAGQKWNDERNVTQPIIGLDERMVPLGFCVYTPATWTLGSLPVEASFNPACLRLKLTDRLRVYAAQADPADPRRFTIRYALNGQPGTIEGWLTNDDHLRYHVIDGPATTRPNLGFVTTAPAE